MEVLHVLQYQQLISRVLQLIKLAKESLFTCALYFLHKRLLELSVEACQLIAILVMNNNIERVQSLQNNQIRPSLRSLSILKCKDHWKRSLADLIIIMAIVTMIFDLGTRILLHALCSFLCLWQPNIRSTYKTSQEVISEIMDLQLTNQIAIQAYRV